MFWGILGAIIFQGLMILVERPAQALGVEVPFTSSRPSCSTAPTPCIGPEVHPEDDEVICKWFSKLYPVSNQHHDDRFFIENGESATRLRRFARYRDDGHLVFAFDSIPAIFGVTRDPFIVFTSNIFAILGLRSLYFVSASMMDRFHLLKYALVIILAFVGIKMLLHEVVQRTGALVAHRHRPRARRWFLQLAPKPNLSSRYRRNAGYARARGTD